MSSLHSFGNRTLELEPGLTDGFERGETDSDRCAAPALRFLLGQRFVGGKDDFFPGTGHAY
jgi:hypothetical protein